MVLKMSEYPSAGQSKALQNIVVLACWMEVVEQGTTSIQQAMATTFWRALLCPAEGYSLIFDTMFRPESGILTMLEKNY